MRPRPDGGGLSLALSSYLGTGMNEHNRGLEQGYGYPGRIEDFGVEKDAWGMDARLGYTLRIQRLSGLLTPFVNFDMAGENNRSLRMGIRYDLANAGPPLVSRSFPGHAAAAKARAADYRRSIALLPRTSAGPQAGAGV